MVHFILVLILSSSGWNEIPAVTKIDGNYSEEMCNSEGKKQTEGYNVKTDTVTVASGTWPDGKKWNIKKQNNKFIRPKFDSYSCVMVNK